MSSQSVKSEYERQGFAQVRDLLSPAEMDVIRAELDRLTRSAGDHPGIILEKDGKTLRSLSNPQRYSDVFTRLIRHPRLVSAVEELLDDKLYVFQLGVNCKAAFGGDIWYWHQDFPTYHYDDHIPEPRMVNTLILVDESNEFNAPLMVVPESHTTPYPKPVTSDKGTSYAIRYMDAELVTRQATQSGLVSLKGAPGSVTFMNTNLIHGSTANMSPFPRRMITLTYNALSNKATHPSVRDRNIVADDSQATALEPLDADCLLRA